MSFGLFFVLWTAGMALYAFSKVIQWRREGEVRMWFRTWTRADDPFSFKFGLWWYGLVGVVGAFMALYVLLADDAKWLWSA